MLPFLVVSQYFRPEPLGIAVYASDYADFLIENSRRVIVVTARPNYPDYRTWPSFADGSKDVERKNGLEVLRAPGRPNGRAGAIDRIRHELALAIQLRKLVQRQPAYSGCLSFLPSCLLFLACPVRRNCRSRTAFAMDIQSGLAGGLGMLGTLPAAMLRRLELASFRRFDRLIVLTPVMADVVRRMGYRGDVHVLPIWVDTDRFAPSTSEPVRTERFVVGYSGNFGRKQGLEVILDAARLLQSSRPDIHFVLQGEGTQSGHLRERASAMGLNNLAFAPLASADTLPASLRSMDVHLVPQLAAGGDYAVPSKLYAIMAVGRPAICTAAPGSTLHILMRESGAFLCTGPADSKALASAVVTLADDQVQRHRLGTAGRQYVLKHCSRSRILPDLAALCESPLP
jgi:colanic acid biosynthesis glycosyl transferase WcaI